MSFTSSQLRLYFIMGSQDCPDQDPIDVLEQAIAGGITMFQFREKNSDLTLSETVALGRHLREICRQHNIPFIVNDRADLALILDADGVHVGQEDLPAREVRRLIGPDKILGVSAENVAEARQAIEDGADYIGVGPMFLTSSKADAGFPIYPEALQAIREQLEEPFPIVGIGGITASNAHKVMAAGADGVAVISAIAKAENPRRAAEALAQAVGSTKM
ncbi:thiamine phosphate synthase [Polycladomyces sp. WAk]|uniref:Thiamine-phosphate synthase n=1 Tax=Polycladomyces zharkentensis TaxID=2807616 RepID=A0ABS2WHW5_9BACL|nr:thiamine phosphate synthase [Polycladomyces sp. WAk]MBN2909066.1 thiamine phosphate synthase [Polycladomyces sp. WAk]